MSSSRTIGDTEYHQLDQSDLESNDTTPKKDSPISLLWLTAFTLYSIALLFVGSRLGQQEYGFYDSDSPIYKLVNPKTTKIQYHNPFWPHNVSIFRQPPSDEVDAAWERISNGRDIVISRDEVIRLGKDPDQTVRADPAWGFGDDAHLGLVHAMHQNHCLDSLRKAVYYNYYYRNKRGFDANPPDDFRAKYYSHMDHCIEFLRLDIACKADLSISTYRWMEGEKVPEADFNTWHQCRNLEDILDWHANHEINKKLSPDEERDRWDNFKPGKGDTIVPQDPEVNASVWDVNFFKPTS